MHVAELTGRFKRVDGIQDPDKFRACRLRAQGHRRRIIERHDQGGPRKKLTTGKLYVTVMGSSSMLDIRPFISMV